MKFDLYEVVQLRSALPERGLPAGAKGAIVLTYDESVDPFYEVEFCDESGSTLALVTLGEDMLRSYSECSEAAPGLASQGESVLKKGIDG